MHEHGAMRRAGLRCGHCGGNVVWSHWTERLQCLLCCRPATGELADALTEQIRPRRRVAAPETEDDEVVTGAA